ncbi:ATP-binding cassette domain-containing protein [Aerococcus urinaeequi]|jgi:ABC-2 type transport system ATP-binding protein|uniref:ABC transporter ATP-binding protein n=2 Tax=Aerococcus TaxID=1375 RepID=A0AA47G9P5_9LACT|nr:MULTISPECIES: ABC transporter ATP-binding protein [Lactobacillales]KAF3300821.1 ATP-binding cassette domain-containing protein [Carnobacterium sp. PL26RED25]KAF3305254.1 ATP-binding cassette domain-containing protein [Carnobacterium sp. PL24RED07]MBR2130901.1 ABC transporter ATP-binding protein [Aerococcus sp.]MCT1798587.1 ABC transporter ATP-binding protein [Aerococcus viridans]MEB7389825.1 ABC transporter ATP-binding protein [Aerococcus viridans]
MIEIEKVNKFYGAKKILEDVSFSIKPGEITALIGENGSGKTSLMNGLMKLTPVASGQFLIDGKPIDFNDFNRISYIPDTIIVVKEMTIQEALDYMATYYDTYDPVLAKDLVTFFNLNPDEKISHLSKGNTAKVNLLLGLTLNSDYLIMDEPFSGVDIFTREEIANVFTSKLMAGRGVLISTHEINEIETLVDRVVMLKDRRIIQDFYTEDLRLEEGKSITDKMWEVYR